MMPYLNVTKALYKDLVSVTKNASTKMIEVRHIPKKNTQSMSRLGLLGSISLDLVSVTKNASTKMMEVRHIHTQKKTHSLWGA